MITELVVSTLRAWAMVQFAILDFFALHTPLVLSLQVVPLVARASHGRRLKKLRLRWEIQLHHAIRAATSQREHHLCRREKHEKHVRQRAVPRTAHASTT